MGRAYGLLVRGGMLILFFLESGWSSEFKVPTELSPHSDQESAPNDFMDHPTSNWITIQSIGESGGGRPRLTTRNAFLNMGLHGPIGFRGIFTGLRLRIFLNSRIASCAFRPDHQKQPKTLPHSHSRLQ
jgi:hypothetical protein